MSREPLRTVIHVGSAPPRFNGVAEHVDGVTARLHPVRLTIDEAAGTLRILAAGTIPVAWPLDDVRRVPDQADPTRMVLAVSDDPVARLFVEDGETLRILRARCKFLHRRPKPRGLGRLLLWAAAAVASVAVIVVLLVPLLADRLADHLPPEGERALGEASLNQIRAALDRSGLNPLGLCSDPAGRAALAQLSQPLAAAADLPHPLDVHVLDHDMLNAFALPGGRVILFRGLIEAAESPDEVAAVLAHEIGHVAHRDPTRTALRSAGSIGVLGLLFGDFAGGAAVLFLTERLIEARYSREAESAADDFALATLAQAEADPGALGRFFDRLRARYGDQSGLVAHFLSHPSLVERIARSAAAARPVPPRALLDPDAWQALRGICKTASDEQRGPE